MARLTFAEIREQGGIISGNDVADSWVKTKMLAWFRKHYAAYPWPFLTLQTASVTLPAGSTGVQIGAGDGGLTPQITRIFSPIYYRQFGSFQNRCKAPIRQAIGQKEEEMFGMIDTSTQIGKPKAFTCFPVSESGKQQMQLLPFPIPDVAYTLGFTYQYLPEDCADTGIPIYPNEMTLIQCAKCAALEYDEAGSELLKEELNILADMVAADRDTYGGTPSYGDSQLLDSSVFR